MRPPDLPPTNGPLRTTRCSGAIGPGDLSTEPPAPARTSEGSRQIIRTPGVAGWLSRRDSGRSICRPPIALPVNASAPSSSSLRRGRLTSAGVDIDGLTRGAVHRARA